MDGSTRGAKASGMPTPDFFCKRNSSESARMNNLSYWKGVIFFGVPRGARRIAGIDVLTFYLLFMTQTGIVVTMDKTR